MLGGAVGSARSSCSGKHVAVVAGEPAVEWSVCVHAKTRAQDPHGACAHISAATRHVAARGPDHHYQRLKPAAGTLSSAAKQREGCANAQAILSRWRWLAAGQPRQAPEVVSTCTRKGTLPALRTLPARTESALRKLENPSITRSRLSLGAGRTYSFNHCASDVPALFRVLYGCIRAKIVEQPLHVEAVCTSCV